MNNIILIGLKSSGKTTIGQQLAESLQRPFIDTDHIILKQFPQAEAIGDVYRQAGSEEFLQLEAQAVKIAISHSEAVIAVGGSTMLQANNASLLKSQGKIIYLSVQAETLLNRLRINPPAFLPRDNFEQAFAEYYRQRAEHYAQLADDIILADDPSEILASILHGLKNSG